MAQIITADGKIVEGTILSDEETAIIQEIVAKIDTMAYELYYNSRTASRTQFAAELINTYHITRRESAPAVEPLEFREVDHVL